MCISLARPASVRLSTTARPQATANKLLVYPYPQVARLLRMVVFIRHGHLVPFFIIGLWEAYAHSPQLLNSCLISDIVPKSQSFLMEECSVMVVLRAAGSMTGRMCGIFQCFGPENHICMRAVSI